MDKARRPSIVIHIQAAAYQRWFMKKTILKELKNSLKAADLREFAAFFMTDTFIGQLVSRMIIKK